jgi:hypothetical protein
MTMQQIIASFDASELAFYQECADRAGETLEEWVAHMDEI